MDGILDDWDEILIWWCPPGTLVMQEGTGRPLCTKYKKILLKFLKSPDHDQKDLKKITTE
jgi:hypothetical protein